ncbi:unnamed protein product [Amoebophrya sp. A120]|nr:unnamed protein product [Amoebophrya sp. A120]|eukprot:GSA120T00019238001.1
MVRYFRRSLLVLAVCYPTSVVSAAKTAADEDDSPSPAPSVYPNPDPPLFLNFDCSRLRNGTATSMEGLGSLFREVRGTRVFANLLGLEPLETVPAAGHGGDWEASRAYFGSLIKKENKELLKDALRNSTSLHIYDDLRRIFAQLRTSGYKAQKTVGKFTIFSNAIRPDEVEQLIEWLGGSTYGQAHNKFLPQCSTKELPTTPKKKKSSADHAKAPETKHPSELCREKVLRASRMERLLPRIQELREAARKSGNVGILNLVSDRCPALMWNGAAPPEVDEELRVAVHRARKKEKKIIEAKSSIKRGKLRFSIAIHIRMGDLLQNVLSWTGKKQREAVTVSTDNKSKPLTVTTEDVFETLERSKMIDEDTMTRMKKTHFLDKCAIRHILVASHGRESEKCQKKAAERRHAPFLKYPVAYFQKVLKSLFQDVPVLSIGLMEKTVDIHIFSDAPEEWFQSFKAAYGAEVVTVHGDGDGKSLLIGEEVAVDGENEGDQDESTKIQKTKTLPADLDHLIFSDILIYGEGNLGRLAAFLNPDGIKLQAPCGRTGNVEGDMVVNVQKNGEIPEGEKINDKFSVMLKNKMGSSGVTMNQRGKGQVPRRGKETIMRPEKIKTEL